MDDLSLKKEPLEEPLIKPLIKPLIQSVDGGENVSLMEPLLLSSKYQQELSDLVLELTAESASFCSSIPTAFVKALAVLVKAMNCYYSNSLYAQV